AVWVAVRSAQKASTSFKRRYLDNPFFLFIETALPRHIASQEPFQIRKSERRPLASLHAT
ncbi:MAG: hypothetical protein OIF48_13475, partial [Silicimonas sp.]|nr:hypothetical protein [Silicimonas sp.]